MLPTEKERLRSYFWSSTRFLSSRSAIEISLGCTSTTNSLVTCYLVLKVITEILELRGLCKEQNPRFFLTNTQRTNLKD